MREVLTFLVGGNEFGIGVGTAVEVLRPLKIREVPDMPDYITGFITVRKDVLPLLDLRKRFSVKTGSGKERVLVVRYASEKVALLVDSVLGIIKYDEAMLKKPPALFKGLNAKYLYGLIELDGKAIMLLDVANVLNSKEKIALRQAMDSMKKSKQV